MADVEPDDESGERQVADSPRAELERAVTDLRTSVQRRKAQIGATRARTESVRAETAMARSGRRRVIGDELYEGRIAALAHEVDRIGDELVSGAEAEAQARRDAAEAAAAATLDAAREEAQAMLDQAQASADQVSTEAGAQLAAIESDRERLDNERHDVLGALASLHSRLGDVAGSTLGGQE